METCQIFICYFKVELFLMNGVIIIFISLYVCLCRLLLTLMAFAFILRPVANFFSKEHCFFELIVKKPIKTNPNQPHKTLHVMIIAWFLLPLIKDVRKIFFSGKWHIPWKCIKLCLNATYCHCQMRRSQSPIIYFSGFNTWLL